MTNRLESFLVKVMAKYQELLKKIPEKDLAVAASTVKKVGTLLMTGAAAPFILAFNSSLKEATQDEQIAIIGEVSQLNREQIESISSELKLMAGQIEALQDFYQRSEAERVAILGEMEKMWAALSAQIDRGTERVITEVKELRAEISQFMDGMAAKEVQKPILNDDVFIREQSQKLKSMEVSQADAVIQSVTEHKVKGISLVKNYSILLARAYLVKGDNYFHQDNFSEAKEQYQQAVSQARAAKDRELLAICLYELGAAVGILEDYDQALKLFDQVIKLKPDFAEAYSNRGLARSDKGDRDGAIKDFEEAIRLNPKDAEAYSNRGVARAEKGDLDGAIKDYDEAIRLNPNLAQAMANMGIAYRLKKDTKNARHWLEEALKHKDALPAGGEERILSLLAELKGLPNG